MHNRRFCMNKHTLKGDWNVLKGKIKEKWGRLTDDDKTEFKGKRDQLLGKFQKKYGSVKEKAVKGISQWEAWLSHRFRSKK